MQQHDASAPASLSGGPAATETAALAQPGDLIFARYPRFKTPDQPGDAFIPCLVLDVKDPQGHRGGPHVTLCRGGTRDIGRVFPGELALTGDEQAAAGLRRECKFDLRSTITVPLRSAFVNEDGHPRLIGRISAAARKVAAGNYARAMRRQPDLPEQALTAPPEPKVGDVVFAFCPKRETPEVVGEYPQPSLVTAVDRRLGPGGREKTYVTLAKGTGSNIGKTFPGEFAITDPGDMATAGLINPRKFDTRDQRLMPWSSEFLVSDGNGPILGALGERDMDQLRHAYGRAHNSSKEMDEAGHLMPRPPRIGDVIYAFSPYEEAPNHPGPKPRPCIVLDARVINDRGRPCVSLLIAPGTSQKLYVEHPGELLLTGQNDMEEAGLRIETKFRLGDPKIIKWSQPYVCFRDGGPILGTLSSRDRERASEIRRSLRMEKDLEFQRPGASPAHRREAPARDRGEACL